MRASDVFLCAVSRSITHTHAVKEATAAGARGLVLTQFTDGMMVRGGILADFRAIAPRCRAMAAALAGSERVRLTTPQGTDLSFSAKGRRGNALYGVVDKGQFSTIPTIEANVSPLEGTANGRIVADASVPYLGIGVLQGAGLLRGPGRLHRVHDGRRAGAHAENDLLSRKDPNVFNIAELGVGMNPCCSFMGFMLEDEGVEGRCTSASEPASRWAARSRPPAITI